MSIAQQIRNALRQIGGPANTAQIAEVLEDEVAGGDVSKQLFSMERQGIVTVNRDERPFTYTLVPERAAELDAGEDTPAPAQKRGAGKKVKNRLAKKAAAKTKSKRAPATPAPAAKPAKRKYTRRAPAAVPPTAAVERRLARVGEGVVLAPDLLRRLCILAINPTDSLTNEDRGVIASCLLLAA